MSSISLEVSPHFFITLPRPFRETGENPIVEILSSLPLNKYVPCSVVDIATGYGLDGARVESRWGARFSAPVQTGPGAQSASCTMGTGSFPGVKSGRGVTLTPHPFLVPWSLKARARPLLPLWAVRPVQSLSASIRVQFTFTFTPQQINYGRLNYG